jgi:pimeloyl-ACP methyl ester carboxylesterase
VRHAYDARVLPRVIWISPDTDPAAGSSGSFAERLGARAQVHLAELTIWRLDPRAAYGPSVETAAVERLADEAGIDRFHLFGFSAGATVALAAALAMPERVSSLALLEPAAIGSDAWHPAEAAWQSEMRRIRALPADARLEPFRRLLMRPGTDPPPPPRRAPSWTARDDLLADLMEDPGFVSSDLARIEQPALVVTGGKSNPRWSLLAARLLEVMPDVRVEVFAGLHHFTPPHRAQPATFEELLVGFWNSSGRALRGADEVPATVRPHPVQLDRTDLGRHMRVDP